MCNMAKQQIKQNKKILRNVSGVSVQSCDCDGEELTNEFGEGPAINYSSRRSFIKRLSAGFSMVPLAWGGKLWSANERLKLAFCGQLLCVVPYEVTRHYGYFAKQGLDVELVYTRGGGNAINALVGRSVDYAASSLDAALGAYNKNAPISRFMVTGSLPLFALATSPKNRNTIRSIKDLEGKTVGISKLGNSDHSLLMFLITKAGGDIDKVRFATLGTNLYEALLQEQVAAGMVQEPALTLINKKGGKTLANFMDTDDSKKLLGGNYEFMGVAVLNDEIKKRRAQIKKIYQALKEGVNATRTMPVEKLVEALPKSLIAGGEREVFKEVLRKNRTSLYPTNLQIDLEATNRVVNANKLSGKLRQDLDVTNLMKTDLL